MGGTDLNQDTETENHALGRQRHGAGSMASLVLHSILHLAPGKGARLEKTSYKGKL